MSAMEQSETTGKIAKALAQFSTLCTGVIKDAQNPHFRNDYASLGSVLDAIRSPLVECGLAVMQFPDNGEDTNQAAITTQIMHESGEWIRCTAAATVAKANPQGFGSAYTYLRRYSLLGALGLGAYDDDGEAASNGPRGR